MLKGSAFLPLLFLALPQSARAASVLSGRAILWSALALALVCLLVTFQFYLRILFSWIAASIKDWIRLGPPRSVGFVFASGYAVIASVFVCNIFPAHPVPRFSDIFLVGIVLTAYWYTWESAVYLLSAATLVMAYVLPPYGTLAVSQPADWWRIASYVAVSVFLIILVHRLKQRGPLSTHRLSHAAD